MPRDTRTSGQRERGSVIRLLYLLGWTNEQMAEVFNSTYSVVRHDIRCLEISATGERPRSLSVRYARTVEFYARRFDREDLSTAEQIVLPLIVKSIGIERLIVRVKGVLDGYRAMGAAPSASAGWRLCEALFPERATAELRLPTSEEIVHKTLHGIREGVVSVPDGEDTLVNLAAQVAWQACGEQLLARVRPMWTPALDAELDRLAHLALDSVNERWRFVVERRCGFVSSPMTMERISRKMGISRERVRQIEVKALDAVRASDGGRDLQRMMRTLCEALEDERMQGRILQEEIERLRAELRGLQRERESPRAYNEHPHDFPRS